MKHPKIVAKSKSALAGEYRFRVMRPTKVAADGSVLEAEPVSPWSAPQRNLILPSGVKSDRNYPGQMGYCQVGTGTTPNKTTLDGTFSQAGTTVSRASGSGVFSAANVGDFVKFGTGERAKIETFTDTLNVEVDRSQTVAAAALTVYDTSRTALDSMVVETQTKEPGGEGVSIDTDAGTTQYWRTFNFPTEVSAQVYTESAVRATQSDTLFSRIVFDSAASVDVGQFLQLRFDLTVTLGNYRLAAPISVNITGWPRPYSIAQITAGTAGGTAFDVQLTEDVSGHYATGRPIIIAGALPPKTNISSIASTGSDFTVTAAGHGKSASDSIVIEGATPSAYNGTWTVASVAGDDIVVTSGINPGAGSGGTVRLATPGTWFDGTWTIDSFPAADTIRILDATITEDAGASGEVTNSTDADAIMAGFAFYDDVDNTGKNCPGDWTISVTYKKELRVLSEAQMKTGLTHGVATSVSPSLGSGYDPTGNGSYDAPSRTATFEFVIPSGDCVSQQIRQFAFWALNGYFFITFDERQRKDDGYQLTVTFSNTWEPELD